MTPRVSVVVPSHERPLRLRWLVNALEEQTLHPSQWEAVVVFDDAGHESAQMLAGHPLAVDGRLRCIRLDPGTGTPSRQRNVGWRAARGNLIAFTDDDCRPEPTWLESLAEAADRHPGAIVQGATRPDPFEADVMDMAPRVRTLQIDPPGPFAQTCNILYPREVLEAVEGFDESITTAAGEDTDLAVRAQGVGTPLAAAADAVVNHAVETYSLPAMLRLSWKWQHLPFVVRRHPELRKLYPLGLFWRRTHAALVLGLAASAALRRPRLLPLLLTPYLRMFLPASNERRHHWPRAVVELPGRVLIDVVEFLALLRGSIRHRTIFL